MKAGWGTVFGWVFSWLPSKEEARRNEYDSLKRKREKLLNKPYTEAIGRRVAAIDRRMQRLTDKAINQ